MDFKEIVHTRYATKKFTGEKIPEQKIEELKELIQYSASSFGLQPFTVIIIDNDEIKAKLKPLSFDQEQITTCSHLLVFCANTNVKSRIDDYQEMLTIDGDLSDSAKNYIEMMRYSLEQRNKDDLLNWSSKQAYLALGNALNGAKFLGFDSCPMEGFDANEFHKVLQLPENVIPLALCPVGIAADEPKPKLRYPKEKLFIKK
ncbi:MAG: NAD(P)H-dependent oxidoreductase [Candidatus Woesearchaeota archaeon]